MLNDLAIQSRIADIQSMLTAMQTGTVPSQQPAVTSAAMTSSSGGQANLTSFAGQLAAASSATSATPTDVSGDTTQYDALIQQSAARNGIDPSLLKGLIRAESNFDPNAGSSAGAQGLTQLMPGTAAGLGVTDVHDPAQAIEGGAKYLRTQLDAFGGDEAKALAAYNAGPGAVTRYGGVPPYAETQQYVQKVLGYAAGYRTQSPLSSTTTTPTIL
jgi:soluble lytic murein transglycosylase-like protein